MDTKECKEFLIECPHCNEYILIHEVNCAIFRHATYKLDGSQIDPHMSKKGCENLIERGLIYGCGKAFQLLKNDDGTFKAVVCDYI